MRTGLLYVYCEKFSAALIFILFELWYYNESYKCSLHDNYSCNSIFLLCMDI